MRQTQAYRVVAGLHYHKEIGDKKDTAYGKGQPAGDVITTSQDLISKFPQKFEKVDRSNFPADVAVAAETPVPPQKPAAAPQESLPVGGEQEEAPNGAATTDVTTQFPKARKLGFLVFERGGKYYVADKDNPSKYANKKGLAKADVEAFAVDQA